MIPRALRFRRFSLRLLALLLGLLFAVLATTYLVVSRANERTAHDHARANLELTARIVSSTIGQRIESLAGNAKVMTGDDALKQVRRTGNNRTLASLLQSFSTRVNAPVITFYNADGDLLATSDPAMENEKADPFRFLIREAIDQDLPQHTGFSYLKQELHVLIVVPYYAPYPNVYGWFGLAFPIDRAFAWKIRETTAVQLTYVSLDPPDRPRVLATTLPDHSLPPVHAAVRAILAEEWTDAMETAWAATASPIPFRPPPKSSRCPTTATSRSSNSAPCSARIPSHSSCNARSPPN